MASSILFISDCSSPDIHERERPVTQCNRTLRHRGTNTSLVARRG
jgi:hypothetical protein